MVISNEIGGPLIPQ